MLELAGVLWGHCRTVPEVPLLPQKVLEQLKQQGCPHVVFADCQRDSNVKKVMGQQSQCGFPLCHAVGR